MTSRWPMVRLVEVLKESDDSVLIEPFETYKEITVRLHGLGVVQRRTTLGAQIAAGSRRVAHVGDLILSRIDSRHGALGIVPPELEGGVVSNDFPLFAIDSSRLLPEFLGWMIKTEWFREACNRASEGSTNRVRIKMGAFLEIAIPLPPLPEQQAILAGIESVHSRVSAMEGLSEETSKTAAALLAARFAKVADGAPLVPLGRVAPVVRRPVNISPDAVYREIGIKSFGRGTFRKPVILGSELGNKRVFQILEGDLLFSNVFAWEGAVAVAEACDDGLIGSHRFITCVAVPGLVASDFLRFHFLTPRGLEDLGAASPGGAGRNRTLGLEKLETLKVPAPHYSVQLAFCSLMSNVVAAELLREGAMHGVRALLRSFVARTLAGNCCDEPGTSFGSNP